MKQFLVIMTHLNRIEYLLKLNFKVFEEETHKITMYDGVTKIILSKIFCAAAEDRYNPNRYCNSLNDLFISPDGVIKLCRYIKKEVNIKNEVKNRDEDGLEKKINLANELKLKYLADNDFANLQGEALKEAIKEKIQQKDGSSLVGNMAAQGTTPRQLTDLIGSLCDLTSGSGDKGTPVVLVQGYFDNYTTE